MKTQFILIVLLLVTISGCKNESNSTDVRSAFKLEGLTLNNNEKWLANKETHIGMKRIDSILKFDSFKDGNKLGKALSKETSYIIKNCNMTGNAHDQLHIVLIPIIELISDIKDVKNTSELEKKVTNLQRLSATYFQYFKN